MSAFISFIEYYTVMVLLKPGRIYYTIVVVLHLEGSMLKSYKTALVCTAMVASQRQINQHTQQFSCGCIHVLHNK